MFERHDTKDKYPTKNKYVFPNPINTIIATIVAALLLAIIGYGVWSLLPLSDNRTEEEKIMADRIDQIDAAIVEFQSDMTGDPINDTIMICANIDSWADWIHRVMDYELRKLQKARAPYETFSDKWWEAGRENPRSSAYWKAAKHVEWVEGAQRICSDW